MARTGAGTGAGVGEGSCNYLEDDNTVVELDQQHMVSCPVQHLASGSLKNKLSEINNTQYPAILSLRVNA